MTRLLLAVLILPALALAASTGLRSGPKPADGLTVTFSTEQNGYLTPCGCTKPMLGGIPRRAAFLKKQAGSGSQIRLDNGDLTQGAGRQDEMKAEALVDMLGSLEYDAVNIGEKDLQFGLPFLEALQSRFKGAMLCANLRRADGSPVFKEWSVLSRALGGKGAKVVVTGLLSEQFADAVAAADPDCKLEPPAQRLEQMDAALVAAGELRILLYHGPLAEAEALATRFPHFRLVIAAHEGDHPTDALHAGGAALVCSGQDGKHVGQATFASTTAKPNVEYTSLGPEFTDDPAILRMKAAYLGRVTAEDLLGKVPKLPAANGDTFAGTKSCAPCHSSAQKAWSASGHARAHATLVAEKHDLDPECMSCHVVGLDRTSGFTSMAKTPHLKDVGCESCHGPAARHVKNPKTPLQKVGSDGCISCHNPENSPKFDFAKYWARVKH